MINTLPSYTVAQIVTPEAIETLERVADELEQVVRAGYLQCFEIWEHLEESYTDCEEEPNTIFSFCTLSAIYELHTDRPFSIVGEKDAWRHHRFLSEYQSVTSIDLSLLVTNLDTYNGYEEVPIFLESFLLWLNDAKKMPFDEQMVYLRQLASEYRECLKQEGVL